MQINTTLSNMFGRTAWVSLCLRALAVFGAPFWADPATNEVPDASYEAIDLSHYGAGIFRKPSEETGKLVSEWSEKSASNPEEMGEYLEGDIIFPARAKNGLVAVSARWDGGIVPYVIKGPYDEKETNMIYRAMEQYHKNTCIR